MKRTESALLSSEKMSDAALSQKLGHYRRMERIWTIVGLLGILGGILSFFLVEDEILTVILVGVLFGGGLCCALFLGTRASQRSKFLLQEQLGEYFQTELEKAFGPALHTSVMRIDKTLLKKIHLLDEQWEECLVDNFYEGIHKDIHFSVANVELHHVYQGGHIQDGRETRRDKVFHGLVLRWKTASFVPCLISIYERTKDSIGKAVSNQAPMDARFCINAKEEIDMHRQLQLMEWINHLEQNVEGQVRSISGERNIITLAIEMDYTFASVASHVDMNHLEEVRSSYRQSLQEMGRMLDLLQAGSPWK